MRSQTTCVLFLGLGNPNKQEEVFVYTKTLLAKTLNCQQRGFFNRKNSVTPDNSDIKTEKLCFRSIFHIVSLPLDVYNVVSACPLIWRRKENDMSVSLKRLWKLLIDKI
jgi:hypothetical protein